MTEPLEPINAHEHATTISTESASTTITKRYDGTSMRELKECRVCEWPQPPDNHHYICPCCGTQASYEDWTRDEINTYRRTTGQALLPDDEPDGVERCRVAWDGTWWDKGIEHAPLIVRNLLAAVARLRAVVASHTPQKKTVYAIIEGRTTQQEREAFGISPDRPIYLSLTRALDHLRLICPAAPVADAPFKE